MQARTVTVPELALIGSTRVALGAGIGLLLAQRITRRQRKAAGLALIGFGAITTIPLLMEVLGKRPAIAEVVRERRSSFRLNPEAGPCKGRPHDFVLYNRFFHNVAFEQSVTEIDFHLVSSHENRDILTDGVADFK